MFKKSEHIEFHLNQPQTTTAKQNKNNKSRAESKA